MYHIVICEDNPEQGKLLADIINHVMNERISVFICQSAAEFEGFLQTHPMPDVVFMDIELGNGENGIDAIKRLIPRTFKTQVIYITGYLKYCTQVYSTPHISFLVKPFQSAQVKTALEQSLAKMEEMQYEGISICIHSQVIYIPFRQLKYIESSGRKLRFVCSDTTYESYMQIKDAVPKLDMRFFQCHKSYIVNLDQVLSCDGKTYTLRNNECIPISTRYRLDSKRVFLNYLSQNISFHVNSIQK